MEEIIIKADKSNLESILSKIEKSLSNYEISIKSKLQLEIAIEEIFVNISNYAYGDGIGDVRIEYFIDENPLSINIRFIDEGFEFNPLEVSSPDTSLSAEDRDIGGLGLVLVRKNIDSISYEYKDNQNILTIKKLF
ncbi:MAG: ATP-binding protein [Methanobrevibacter sp.]